MMGTREVVQRGSYVNSANTVVQLPASPSQLFIEDKSILHQPPPLRFNKTDINVINVDPIQVSDFRSSTFILTLGLIL